MPGILPGQSIARWRPRHRNVLQGSTVPWGFHELVICYLAGAARVRERDKSGTGAAGKRGAKKLLKHYSWAGICCSISRHALILSRRQTQHRGSGAAIVVSAPQTEHLTAFVKRSGEIARFACSRISAGTTASGFSCAFRFIRSVRVLFSLWQMSRPDTSAVLLTLSSFRESGPQQQRPEPSCIADIFAHSSPADTSRADRSRPDRMGADRAVSQSLSVTFSEFFHIVRPLHLIGRRTTSKGCAKFVRFLSLQFD